MLNTAKLWEARQLRKHTYVRVLNLYRRCVYACVHAQRALVTGVAEILGDDSYLAPGTTEGSAFLQDSFPHGVVYADFPGQCSAPFMVFVRNMGCYLLIQLVKSSQLHRLLSRLRSQII